MAPWERSLHLACAQAEDKRNQDIVRQCLEFMAKIWAGSSDEPTPEKPIVATSFMTEKTETTVKKVLNLDYDAQVERLRASSIAIRADGVKLISKITTENQSG